MSLYLHTWSTISYTTDIGGALRTQKYNVLYYRICYLIPRLRHVVTKQQLVHIMLPACVNNVTKVILVNQHC